MDLTIADGRVCIRRGTTSEPDQRRRRPKSNDDIAGEATAVAQLLQASSPPKELSTPRAGIDILCPSSRCARTAPITPMGRTLHNFVLMEASTSSILFLVLDRPSRGQLRAGTIYEQSTEQYNLIPSTANQKRATQYTPV
jgi:hypothetical protein